MTEDKKRLSRAWTLNVLDSQPEREHMYLTEERCHPRNLSGRCTARWCSSSMTMSVSEKNTLLDQNSLEESVPCTKNWLTSWLLQSFLILACLVFGLFIHRSQRSRSSTKQRRAPPNRSRYRGEVESDLETRVHRCQVNPLIPSWDKVLRVCALLET